MTPNLTYPRTTGEILDDAWRLAIEDYPLLFTATALFLVPFFSAILLLMTMPAPDVWLLQLGSAIFVALLAVMTGIGSGISQELFRRRVDGHPAAFAPCRAAALRRAPDHMAAR